LVFCFLITRLPPLSSLFPYTTLFRSRAVCLDHPRTEVLTDLFALERVHLLAADLRVRHETSTGAVAVRDVAGELGNSGRRAPCRSEEHTSELQSRENLVCRLLLEKKK